jgi:hypothetical protein
MFSSGCCRSYATTPRAGRLRRVQPGFDTTRKDVDLIKESAPMARIQFCLTGIVLVAVMNCTAIAQAPEPTTKPEPAASASDSSKPSTATQVQAWSIKHWVAAKKEWAKDKTKWSDCRKQSSEQKLAGRKSWSFLYTCMTS